MLLFEDHIDQFTNLGGSFCRCFLDCFLVSLSVFLNTGVCHEYSTTSSLQHANGKVDCALVAVDVASQ